MKLMPPPGPERRRALAVLALALAALVYFGWQYFSGGPAETAAAASNTKTPESTTAMKNSALPEPLNLPALEPVPEEPKAARNPFRFGAPPAPPAPPPRPAPLVMPTPAPPPVAPPLPPPTVPLTLNAIYEVAPGKRFAYLNDGQGGIFKGLQGDVVDGRYRLLVVGEKSVVVAFLDGSGQKTLTVK